MILPFYVCFWSISLVQFSIFIHIFKLGYWIYFMKIQLCTIYLDMDSDNVGQGSLKIIFSATRDSWCYPCVSLGYQLPPEQILSTLVSQFQRKVVTNIYKTSAFIILLFMTYEVFFIYKSKCVVVLQITDYLRIKLSIACR